MQLVSGSSLLLVGFVSPCWHLGIVGFCFCFCFFSSFGGSNSCSDSCEGGKFMGAERRKKMGFGGINVKLFGDNMSACFFGTAFLLRFWVEKVEEDAYACNFFLNPF